MGTVPGMNTVCYYNGRSGGSSGEPPHSDSHYTVDSYGRTLLCVFVSLPSYYFSSIKLK